MLHIILFCALFILMLRQYEKTVIVVAVISCYLTMYKDPFNTVGNLYLTMSFVAIIMGLQRYGVSLIVKNPFFLCLIPVLLSYIYTMFRTGFYPKQFIYITSQYVFPCIFYFALNSKNKVQLFVKCLSVFAFIAILYSLFEEITSSNPIMHWCENNMSSFTWLHDRTEHRFGIKRAQSFFSGEAAFGQFCIFAFILLFTMMSDKMDYLKNGWRKMCVLMLPLFVFMTGTRSIILSFVISILTLATFSNIKKYKFLMVVLALVLVALGGSYFGSIYDSMFVDSTEIGGSSSEMREGQWEIAFYYMSQNFWCGNGIGFTGGLLRANEAGLYGAEGMWLPIMMDRGCVGVVATMLSFLIGLFIIIKTKEYLYVWLWISFLVMKTITTGVGIEPSYYTIPLIVLFRYNQFYKGKYYMFLN